LAAEVEPINPQRGSVAGAKQIHAQAQMIVGTPAHGTFEHDVTLQLPSRLERIRLIV
jgi:hypothetical protein